MDAANGVGLAANQVGVGKRMFVYDCPDGESCAAKRRRGEVINPVLETSAIPETMPDPTTTTRAASPCPVNSSRLGARGASRHRCRSQRRPGGHRGPRLLRAHAAARDRPPRRIPLRRRPARTQRRAAKRPSSATAGANRGSPGCPVRSRTRSGTTTRRVRRRPRGGPVPLGARSPGGLARCGGATCPTSPASS